MLGKKFRVCGIFFLCSLHVHVTDCHALDELVEKPVCTPRFDYDFKMVKTMVDIAKENEELRKGLAALTARVDQLTAQRPTGGVAFYSQRTTNLDRIGNHHIIKFDHVTTNTGGGYHSNSGIFEAPKSGTYVFHWVTMNGVKSFLNTELCLNGKVYGKAISDAHDHMARAVAANLVILRLENGDQVWVRSGTWHSGNMIGEYYCTFSGYLLF